MQNRRGFLKLGAGAAMGGLATALPTASMANECPQKIKWDETVDNIIIGSGFSGLSAALNLKKKNLGSVLVLEKMEVIGGNSAVNGGWLAIPKNPVQLSQGIHDDSPMELVSDQIAAGRGMQNTQLLTKIANRALDVYHMCIDHGVEFKKDFNIQVGGHNKARAMRLKNGVGGDITTKFYDSCIKAGVDIRLQNYLEDLILENGKIIGVKVKRNYRFPNERTGQSIFIKAKNGVILANGGFARNMKLRSIVDPSLDPTLDCTNPLGATGEAMLNAMDHGALAIHLNMIQSGHWGSPDEGGFGWSNALLSIGWHKGISVSVLNGKRYMDERADRKTCSEAEMKQRNSDGSPAYPVVFFNYNDHANDERVTRALRDKMAWKVDSLEALASKFNIPLKQLKNTTKEFNQFVDKKLAHEPNFNRKMDTAVTLKPPFVVSRVWPKVHYCMGGLKIDVDAKVIESQTLEPIKNLYAIGETTGGVHGETRLSSTSCLECIAMGMVVSETIEKEVKG